MSIKVLERNLKLKRFISVSTERVLCCNLAGYLPLPTFPLLGKSFYKGGVAIID